MDITNANVDMNTDKGNGRSILWQERNITETIHRAMIRVYDALT